MKSFPRMWLFHILMALLAAFILYSAFSTAPADPVATALARDVIEQTAKTWDLKPIILNASPQNVLDAPKIDSQFQQMPPKMGAFQSVTSFVGRGGKISPVSNKKEVHAAATFKATVLYERGGTELSVTTIQLPDGTWKLFNYEVTEAQYLQQQQQQSTAGNASATNAPTSPR